MVYARYGLGVAMQHQPLSNAEIHLYDVKAVYADTDPPESMVHQADGINLFAC